MGILDKINDFGSIEVGGRQVPIALIAVGAVAGVALIVRSRGGGGSGLTGNSPGRNAQIDEAAARTIEAVGNAQDYLANKGEAQTQGLLERLGILENSLTTQNEAFANSLSSTANELRNQLGQQGTALRDQIRGSNQSLLDTLGSLVDQINAGFGAQYQNISAISAANERANRDLSTSLGSLWNSFNALYAQVYSTPPATNPPSNPAPAPAPVVTPPANVVVCSPEFPYWNGSVCTNNPNQGRP